MSWLEIMKFFWRVSEKHWLFLPFCWLGDWMEDFGLDHGFIRLKNQEQLIARARAMKVIQRNKRLGDLLGGVDELSQS